MFYISNLICWVFWGDFTGDPSLSSHLRSGKTFISIITVQRGRGLVFEEKNHSGGSGNWSSSKVCSWRQNECRRNWKRWKGAQHGHQGSPRTKSITVPFSTPNLGGVRKAGGTWRVLGSSSWEGRGTAEKKKSLLGEDSIAGSSFLAHQWLQQYCCHWSLWHQNVPVAVRPKLVVRLETKQRTQQHLSFLSLESPPSKTILLIFYCY